MRLPELTDEQKKLCLKPITDADTPEKVEIVLLELFDTFKDDYKTYQANTQWWNKTIHDASNALKLTFALAVVSQLGPSAWLSTGVLFKFLKAAPLEERLSQLYTLTTGHRLDFNPNQQKLSETARQLRTDALLEKIKDMPNDASQTLLLHHLAERSICDGIDLDYLKTQLTGMGVLTTALMQAQLGDYQAAKTTLMPLCTTNPELQSSLTQWLDQGARQAQQAQTAEKFRLLLDSATLLTKLGSTTGSPKLINAGAFSTQTITILQQLNSAKNAATSLRKWSELINSATSITGLIAWFMNTNQDSIAQLIHTQGQQLARMIEASRAAVTTAMREEIGQLRGDLNNSLQAMREESSAERRQIGYTLQRGFTQAHALLNDHKGALEVLQQYNESHNDLGEHTEALLKQLVRRQNNPGYFKRLTENDVDDKLALLLNAIETAKRRFTASLPEADSHPTNEQLKNAQKDVHRYFPWFLQGIFSPDTQEMLSLQQAINPDQWLRINAALMILINKISMSADYVIEPDDITEVMQPAEAFLRTMSSHREALAHTLSVSYAQHNEYWRQLKQLKDQAHATLARHTLLEGIARHKRDSTQLHTGIITQYATVSPPSISPKIEVVIREGGAAVPLHAAQKLVESGIGVFLLPFVAPHILFFGAFAPPEIRELRPQYKITPMQDLWNQYIADIQAALADRDAPEAHLGADVLQHFSADGISGLNTYLALNFEHLFPINIAWIRVHDQQWPIPLKNWIPQIRDYIKGRLGQAGIHLFSRYFLGLNTFKLVLNLQEDSRVYQGKNFFTPKDNATYDLAIEVYDSNGQITATINITTLTLTYPTKNFEQNSYATMFSKKLNKLPTTILLAIVHQFYSYAVDNKERPNTILTMLPPADALPNLTDIGPLRQKMVALEKCLQDFLLQKENATLPHSRGTAGFVAAHQEALILTAGQCAALLKELDRLILMMQGQLALAGINAADMPRERMPVNSIGYPQLLETGAMPTQLAPNLTNLAYKTGTEKQVEENLGRLSDLFKKPSTEEGRAGANAATPGPGGQGQRL